MAAQAAIPPPSDYPAEVLEGFAVDWSTRYQEWERAVARIEELKPLAFRFERLTDAKVNVIVAIGDEAIVASARGHRSRSWWVSWRSTVRSTVPIASTTSISRPIGSRSYGTSSPACRSSQ